MASPVGHLAFGAATAVVVAGATGAADSPALWAGVAIASLAPDLDVIFPLVGLSERLHRNGTHSLTFAAALVAITLIGTLAFPQPSGVVLTWVAALLSHCLLDVLTTGPTLGRLGWGVPLLWPFSGRRFYVQRPLFVGDRQKSRGMGDMLREVWEDAVRIVPVCLVVVIMGELWR